MPTDEKLPYDRVLFEIRVIESLRGTEKVGDVVNIRTGFGAGDCGYTFKIGGKYLIDASKSEGAFLTGICSSAPSQHLLRTVKSSCAVSAD